MNKVGKIKRSKMTRRKITLCFVIIVQFLTVWGQDNIGLYNFSYYGSKEGLPQEDILSIYQDRKGYVWFGTQSGAARYNGRNTKLYSTANGLAHNSVFDIAQDAAGIVYFATPNGISVLENDSLRTVFQGNMFNFIFVDKNNRKWFYGEKECALLTADGKQVDIDEKLKRNFQRIYSVAQHPDSSSIYLATDKGLFYLTENYDCIEILSSSEIYSLYVDNESFLWIAGENQLHRVPLSRVRPNMKLYHEDLYPFVKQRIKKITQAADCSIWGITGGFAFQIDSFDRSPEIYNRANGLAGYTLYSLLCDYENNTWIGLSGGLQKLGDKSVRKLASDELNGYITALHEDKKGRIWFAVDNIVCYIFNNEIIKFSERLFPVSSEYKSISTTKFSDGNILIVHPLGLGVIDVNTLSVIYTRHFEKPIEYVECAYVSSKNEIFISDSYNGLLYYLSDYTSPSKKFDSDVSSGVYMFAEYQGRVMAANHAGLCAFNGTSFEQELTLDHSAWSLFASGDSLWLGTENGLGLYRSGMLHYLTEGAVNSICHGRDADHLWVGRNDGTYYINLNTGRQEIKITNKTGLPHNEISVGALIQDKNELLWMGTYHGMAVFDYKKLPHFFTAPRNDLVIKQNGVEVGKLDPNALPAFNHSVQFDMTALSFVYESDNIYEYSLKGSSKDSLSVMGKESTVRYVNLPPGEYTFTFRSKGASDIWSNYTYVRFTVSKPFWMQWWFYAVCFLAACGLLYLLIRGYIGILQQRNKTLEATVAERTAQIQSKSDEIGQQNLLLKEAREEMEAQNEELTAQNNELFETYSTLQTVNEELQSYKRNLEKMVAQKTAELLKAKDKAEESDRLKSAFLANMSHEIRTPMNGIMGFLNIIEQKNLPPEKLKEYFKIINSNSQRLLKLIDDILDISKLEVGQLKIVKAPCRLNDLMQELYVFYNETVLRNPQKKLTLILDDSDNISDFTVYVDPSRIKQILSNMIDNAIKFTEFGYIKYGYRLDGNRILFYVEDTGVGMDEDRLNIVFERFRQADESISQRYGGTGLGLAISKNLVDLMGGEMWAKSQPGEGTTFFFTIPYEKVSE